MLAEDDIFAEIARLKQADQPFCLATIVRTADATSARAGCKAIVGSDGTIRGFLGGGCVQRAVRKAAQEALQEQLPKMIRVKPGAPSDGVDSDGAMLHPSGCPSGGTVDIFIDPQNPEPRILLCGDGPVARGVAAIGRAMGYPVHWCLPAAAQSQLGQMAGAPLPGDLHFHDQATIGDGLAQAGDYIILATQGRGDLAALQAALASPAHYVAFIGSKRKAANLREKLQAAGLDAATLLRLSAPAGLAIHAIAPTEIALAVLAEITMHRRQHQRDHHKMLAAVAS